MLLGTEESIILGISLETKNGEVLGMKDIPELNTIDGKEIGIDEGIVAWNRR